MGQDQGQAQWVSCQLDEGQDVEYKPLKRVRGFLNYVMQVYPSMIPYLPGFHGTLDSWHPNRSADGFEKRLNKEREEDLDVKRPPRKRRKLVSFPTGVGEQDDPIEDHFDSSYHSDSKFGLHNEGNLGEEDQFGVELAKSVHETNEQGSSHPLPGKLNWLLELIIVL
jgi:hypothetical protein